MDSEGRCEPAPPAELQRELNVLDAISIVVGTIMGSAIFLVPSFLAGEIVSPKVVTLVWIAGGALTVFGALSLAELGSMYPGAGGLYVYLREAYGPLPAFLYGWTLLVMVHSGSIAALALGFSVYAGHFLHFAGWEQKAITAVCILLLTGANCLGIRVGKFLQNTLTVVKLGGVGLMITLLLSRGALSGMLQANWKGPALAPGLTAVGAGMVAVLWAYEGWHVVSFAAGEMRRPRVDLPRSLGTGMAIIVGIYLLANLSYYSVLTSAEIRSNPGVAAAAMAKCFGTGASQAVALLVLISALGSLNGMVATGPRVYYAMARDGFFFRRFAAVGRKYKAPTFALLVQGMWAALLSCSGSYQQLFTDVIFSAWLFYGLTVAGVIVLRMRQPHIERPYRVPMFPWSPLLFCAAALWIAVSTVAKSPQRSLWGLGLILVGVPIFFLFRHRSQSIGRDSLVF